MERLTADDRKRIAQWIRTLAAIEPAPVDCVAESAPEYHREPRFPYMTVEQYLEFEHASGERHEYIASSRSVPSLEEYLVIEQDTCGVSIYRRSDAWLPVLLQSMEDVARLPSIDLSLPLSQIYDGVTLASAEVSDFC